MKKNKKHYNFEKKSDRTSLKDVVAPSGSAMKEMTRDKVKNLKLKMK